jgi:alcohol dehydrogenase class IV
MLPHVMEFNLIGNAEKFSDIAKALGEKTEHLSIRESAIRAAEIVKQILNELSVPFKLKEYDIKQEAIPTLVEGAMKQTRLFAVNPRDLREEDLQEIYQRAW